MRIRVAMVWATIWGVNSRVASSAVSVEVARELNQVSKLEAVVQATDVAAG